MWWCDRGLKGNLQLGDVAMKTARVPTRLDSSNDRLTRRDFVKAGLGVVGLAGLGVGAFAAKVWLWPHQLVYKFPETQAEPVTLLTTPECGAHEATDSYEEGPFYTPNTPLKTDFRRPGHRGRELTLRGRVYDTACRVIPNAVLDLWQVDEHGAYDNIGYDYRGHLFTNAHGMFEVKTIVPVPYSFAGIWRARHIHVKVQGRHTKLLTTQLFFPDDPIGNARDTRLDPRLLVDMQTAADGSAEAVFNFVLRTA
jgi:protocatechuate 3,4-dioxygenase beta subunit